MDPDGYDPKIRPSDVAAFTAMLNRMSSAHLARDPACWAWPVPDVADPLDRFAEFHDGRCAACGHVAPLVLDHDHDSGLVRGYLCRTCNGREPAAEPGTTRAKYRTQPPAAIVAVSHRYVSPFHGGPVTDP